MFGEHHVLPKTSVQREMKGTFSFPTLSLLSSASSSSSNTTTTAINNTEATTSSLNFIENLGKSLKEHTFEEFWQELELCKHVNNDSTILGNNNALLTSPISTSITSTERLTNHILPSHDKNILVHISMAKRSNGRGGWKKTRINFTKIGKFRQLTLKFQPAYSINIRDYYLEVIIEKIQGDEANGNLFCCSSDICCKKDKVSKDIVCHNYERKQYLIFDFSSTDKNIFQKHTSLPPPPPPPSSPSPNLISPSPSFSPIIPDASVPEYTPSRTINPAFFPGASPTNPIYSTKLYFKPHFIQTSKMGNPSFSIAIYLVNRINDEKAMIFSNRAVIINPKGESRGVDMDKSRSALFEDVSAYSFPHNNN